MAQFHVGSSLASKNMLEAAKRCSLAHPRLAKWTGSSPVMYRNKLWGDIFYIFRSNIFGVHSFIPLRLVVMLPRCLREICMWWKLTNPNPYQLSFMRKVLQRWTWNLSPSNSSLLSGWSLHRNSPKKSPSQILMRERENPSQAHPSMQSMESEASKEAFPSTRNLKWRDDYFDEMHPVTGCQILCHIQVFSDTFMTVWSRARMYFKFWTTTFNLNPFEIHDIPSAKKKRRKKHPKRNLFIKSFTTKTPPVDTPPKFNSSPLKNGAWKTSLSYWLSATFQGLCQTSRGYCSTNAYGFFGDTSTLKTASITP